MRRQLGAWTVGLVVATAGVSALVTLSVTRMSGQQTAASVPAVKRPPARVAGHPNFSGMWQAVNEANWDLEAHEARPGMVTQQGIYPYDYARVPAAPVLALGSAGGVPGSVGVVQGDGKIPDKPDALKIKRENAEHWIDRDPELKCYLAGTPRGMYMPYPIELTQSATKLHVAYEY